jgi:hypothetical protein
MLYNLLVLGAVKVPRREKEADRAVSLISISRFKTMAILIN